MGKKGKGRAASPAPEEEKPELPPDGYVPFTAKVKVMAMSGDEFNLEEISSSYVKDLKLKIQEKMQIPAVCQRLAMDEAVLLDTEYLGKHCSAGAPELNLVIVKTLEKLYNRANLNSEEVQALRQLGLNDEVAVKTLGLCMRKGRYRGKGSHRMSRQMQPLLLEALVHLGNQGDTNVLAVFMEFLVHEDTAVRDFGIAGFEQCAKDNEAAPVQLLQFLKTHETFWVTEEGENNIDFENCHKLMAAAEALGKIAQPGDAAVAGFLTRLLPTANGELAQEAQTGGYPLVVLGLLDCLGGALDLTDLKAVDIAIKAVADLIVSARSKMIQRTAVEIVCKLFRGCDMPTIVPRLHVLMTSPSADTRAAGVQLLSRLPVEPGDEVVMCLAASLIDNHQDHVRAGGIVLLGNCSRVGNAGVLATLVQHLKDSAAIVVRAAVEAIGQAGSRGDEDVVKVLVSSLDHADSWVRAAVPAALLKVSPDAAVVPLVAYMATADSESLQATIQSLGAVMFASDEQRLICAEAVCGYLEHHDELVRSAVLKVLPQLAPKGEGCALQSLRQALFKWNQDDTAQRYWRDQLDTVRLRVARLLLCYGIAGNKQALEVLQEAVDDDVRIVSEVATSTLKELEGEKSGTLAEKSKAKKKRSWSDRVEEAYYLEEEE